MARDTPSLLFVLAAFGCSAPDVQPEAPEVHAPPATPPTIAVHVEPQRGMVRVGESLQLSAAVAGLDDARVQWSVRDSKGELNPGGGTVTGDGLYTPSSTIGKWFFVRATSAIDPDVHDTAWIEVIPADGPSVEERLGLRWLEVERDGWILHHAEGQSEDAERVAALVDRSLAQLTQYFADRDPRRLLLPVDLAVYVHPWPDLTAGVATMTIQTSGSEADVHVLAPSAHPGAPPGGWAPGYDELYFHKNLAHELSTVFLEQLAAQKPTGFTFHQAPSWFVQGCEEYVGCLLAEDRRRLERYARAVAADPERVVLDEDAISVREVYGDGCALVLFLSREWGEERVLDLLERPDAEFWSAVEAELGVTAPELIARFHDWLAGRYG